MKILILLLFNIFLYSNTGFSQVDNDVSTRVEQMPQFKDGVEAMYKFIYEKIKYPAEARKKRVLGQVVSKFIVDENGLLKDIHIVRGIGYGCDEEVVRILELMNSEKLWKAGTINGEPVPVDYTLPIKFVLR